MCPMVHWKPQHESLFNDDLLDISSIKFAQGLFKKSDLLYLLSEFCIIAKVECDNTTYYFIPSVLSPENVKI